jgi:pimeloyl-ACP methyl ester carboxylesterase
MMGKELIVACCAALAFAGSGAASGAAAEQLLQRQAPGEHLAKLDGVDIHYRIEGHGPLLVIQVPGWGIGTEYLEKGLAPLQQQFTVLSYDPRGTGRSTPVSASAHLGNKDLADDLEQLRAYLGLDTMDLVSHSNGSAIAILYAELHPVHVRKLVLIGAQLLGYRGDKGPDEVAEIARRKTEPLFAEYVARMKEPDPQDDAEFTRQFKGYAGYFFYDPARDVPTLLSVMTQPMSVSMYKAFLESPPAKDAPPLADLGNITARTLVLDGRQDPVCPLAESERIHAGIAGSELVAIDKAGHFPWIEQREVFFAAVGRFLRR